MGLSQDDLNELDEWILDFLGAHEWATPNLIRQQHGDVNEIKSRQWVSDRILRLEEHEYIERVHPEAAERQLVTDPRDDI